MSKGILYVVATPIGNLDDMTFRAVKVLQGVELIAAEDTRHSRPLLRYHGIETPVMAMHEYNEQTVMEQLLERLAVGQHLALIADAGTPLISDPGFVLVREARRRGMQVVPVPGASAVICALSAAGLPTDRFLFTGFPPRQSAQRQRWFAALARVTETLVFYESCHRIVATLKDLVKVMGPQRQAVIARELTKLYETFLQGSAGELLERVCRDEDQRKGEFVILIHGVEPGDEDDVTIQTEQLLHALVDELPVKKAAELAAKITGRKRNDLYKRILFMKEAKGVN